jgi:hypothetical protein
MLVVVLLVVKVINVGKLQQHSRNCTLKWYKNSKKNDIVCVTGLKTKKCFVPSMQMLPKLEQFMLVLPF